MSDRYDAIVVGGGPAGAVAALVLARARLRACVLEKTRHPRFHIGESILPRALPLLVELGLEGELRKLSHVPKYGAEFGFGDDPKTMSFRFSQGLVPGTPTFNIERSHLDAMLLRAARESGAEVREDTAVQRITRLDADDVEVETAAGPVAGRILLDCSGHGTLVGRHLKTRRIFEDPHLQKVAYFQHFENVWRPPGDATGDPAIIMCREGWFWLIGLSETKTSVGFVTRPPFAKQVGVTPDRMLRWAIRHCPVVTDRMRDAVGPDTNEVLSDFSYTCRPTAGPGYFLVGDAGCFLDPIFSTGVTLAMVGGQQAARQTIALLRDGKSAAAAAREYTGFVEGSTSVFWRLIRNFYRHSFRELFMEGQGPLDVHRAVISTLAGQVFPRPPWALRWRLRFFELCVFLQRYVRLVPRRRDFSLLQEASMPAGVSRAGEVS